MTDKTADTEPPDLRMALIELRHLRAEVARLRPFVAVADGASRAAEHWEAETKRWLAFIERGMETHMRFGVIREDGTEEELPCADWCYACRVERAEATAQRVIDLYERWNQTSPPLGTSMTGYFQWWREHLAELHAAILPPEQQPGTNPTKENPVDQQAQAERRADIADNVTAGTKELMTRRTETLRKRAEDAEQQRDGAYSERAHLVALLAATTDGAVITYATDIDEPGWQIVYLTIGGRQASWHISPRDADLFGHVERVEHDDPRAHWDGHTTEEKYAGIAAWTAELAQRCGPACSEQHTEAGRCELAR